MPGLRFTLINAGVNIVYGITLYGSKRIQVVPAAIIREGLPVGRIPFDIINSGFLIFIIVGILVIAFGQNKPSSQNENGDTMK